MLLSPVKWILRIVILLVLALVGVAFFADGLAKTGVEKGATAALGLETTLDDISLGFFTGKVSLEGLGVANPKVFGDGRFLELGEGTVEVSPWSLLGDKIEVPEIRLSKVRLNLIQGLQGSNYASILDHLQKFQGGGSDASSDGKRFLIKKLTIEDVLLTVAPVKALNLSEVKLPIEKIVLTDIGSDGDEGVLLSELTGIVIEAVLKRASASGGLPPMVQNALSGKLGGLKGLANAKLQDLLGGKAGGGVPDKSTGVGDALKKGIGELLGK